MIDLTTAAKNARLAGLRDFIDSGSGTAAILFYATPRPALGGTPSGAMLASVPLPSPCGTVVGGELHLDVGTWGNVLASGNIEWARIVNRDGVAVADLGVGLTDSGADVEINAIGVFSGGLLAVTAAILRE